MSTQEKTFKNGQYTLWQILGIWLVAGAHVWLSGAWSLVKSTTEYWHQ